jgi:hypothetical protein
MEIATVVVPPNPEAADEEMVKTLNFGLLCPEVRYFVLASNDSGFRNICLKIRENGRRIHIITSKLMAEESNSIGTKSVYLSDLLTEKVVNIFHKEKRQPDLQNRFMLSAVRIKDGQEMKSSDDMFAWGCYQIAKDILADENALSFTRLADAVWYLIGGQWRAHGQSMRECRKVLSALVSTEIIKSEIRESGENVKKVYFI